MNDLAYFYVNILTFNEACKKQRKKEAQGSFFIKMFAHIGLNPTHSVNFL